MFVQYLGSIKKNDRLGKEGYMEIDEMLETYFPKDPE